MKLPESAMLGALSPEDRKRAMMVNALQSMKPGQMTQGATGFEGLTNALGNGIAGMQMGKLMPGLFGQQPAPGPGGWITTVS